MVLKLFFFFSYTSGTYHVLSYHIWSFLTNLKCFPIRPQLECWKFCMLLETNCHACMPLCLYIFIFLFFLFLFLCLCPSIMHLLSVSVSVFVHNASSVCLSILMRRKIGFWATLCFLHFRKDVNQDRTMRTFYRDVVILQVML